MIQGVSWWKRMVSFPIRRPRQLSAALYLEGSSCICSPCHPIDIADHSCSEYNEGLEYYANAINLLIIVVVYFSTIQQMTGASIDREWRIINYVLYITKLGLARAWPWIITIGHFWAGITLLGPSIAVGRPPPA